MSAAPAHWIVFRETDPKVHTDFPWYVEHHSLSAEHAAIDPVGGEHWADDHEYGSFKTHAEALRAAASWYAEECVA